MITLIHGQNNFLSWQKLQEMKKDISSLQTFDDDTFDFSFFVEKASTQSLFHEEITVLLKNVLSTSKKETSNQILDFLKKNKNTSHIIFYENKAVKKNTKIFKFIQKEGQVLEFPKLNKREIKNWIKAEFQKDNYTTDYETMELMLTWSGNDLWLLSNEIEKLKISKLDTKKINCDDVRKFSSVQTSGNIFEFVDALGYKNKKKSLSVFTQIVRKGESPYYIFSMIIRQYRLLIQVKDLISRGKNSTEITKTLKLAPFVTGKLISQAKSYNLEELIKIYTKLLNIDIGIKKGEDPILMMQLLIEEIS